MQLTVASFTDEEGLFILFILLIFDDAFVSSGRIWLHNRQGWKKKKMSEFSFVFVKSSYVSSITTNNLAVISSDSVVMTTEVILR